MSARRRSHSKPPPPAVAAATGPVRTAGGRRHSPRRTVQSGCRGTASRPEPAPRPPRACVFVGDSPASKTPWAPVTDTVTPAGGFGHQFAAALRLASGRRVFVKAAPADDPLTAANLHEADVCSSLPPGAPAPELLGTHRAPRPRPPAGAPLMGSGLDGPRPRRPHRSRRPAGRQHGPRPPPWCDLRGLGPRHHRPGLHRRSLPRAPAGPTAYATPSRTTAGGLVHEGRSQPSSARRSGTRRPRGAVAVWPSRAPGPQDRKGGHLPAGRHHLRHRLPGLGPGSVGRPGRPARSRRTRRHVQFAGGPAGRLGAGLLTRRVPDGPPRSPRGIPRLRGSD